MKNKVSQRRQSAGAARVWVLVGVAVVAVALAAWWWKGRDGTASGEGPASAASGASKPGAGAGGGRFGRTGPQPVSVATVQRRDMAVAIDALGSIASANTAVVRAKVSG